MRCKLGPAWLAVAALCVVAAWPALADTQFRVRQMTRNDIPPGKGQCDIRLRVDGEVEVSVRGDMVYVRTISGRGALDEGSECNESFAGWEHPGFQVRGRGRPRGTPASLAALPRQQFRRRRENP